MVPAVEKEQALELKKHINAIHCTNNLTLIQRKLFNALLFNAYADLPDQSQFQISARALCTLIGYNSNDYGKLKKALLALMSVAIEWNIIDYSSSEPRGKWQASSAVSSAKLENGICTYEYSSLMRELLHHPEIYGRLNMGVLAKFKSSYGIALYENCIRFQGLPQTPWFALEVFRKLMGVGEDKYEVFKDFKKRVLNIAVEEVNAFAPIMVLPEIKRKNQKVTSIRFKLQTKGPMSKELAAETGDDGELINLLANDFHLSPEAIKDLFTDYSFAYIQQKVDLIMASESFRAGKIRGLAGYLMDALKRDYKSKRGSNELQAEQVLLEEQEQAQLQMEAAQQERYSQYVNSSINSFIDSLSSEELESLIAQFAQELKTTNNFASAWLFKYGLEHRGVRALFNNFVKRLKAEELALVSFSKFNQDSEEEGGTFAG